MYSCINLTDDTKPPSGGSLESCRLAPLGGVTALGAKGRVCATCRRWRPHFHYPSIGVCMLYTRLTLVEDSCRDWEPLRVRKGVFYWCETCRTRISWEEVEIHLQRGHRVYEGSYVEPDVKEEIVAAIE